jgi:hypothetical protein
MIAYGVPKLFVECCISMCVPEMFSFNSYQTSSFYQNCCSFFFRPERRFEYVESAVEFVECRNGL